MSYDIPPFHEPSFEEFEARLPPWVKDSPSGVYLVMPVVGGPLTNPTIGQFQFDLNRWNRSKGERLKIYEEYIAAYRQANSEKVKAVYLPPEPVAVVDPQYIHQVKFQEFKDRVNQGIKDFGAEEIGFHKGDVVDCGGYASIGINYEDFVTVSVTDWNRNPNERDLAFSRYKANGGHLLFFKGKGRYASALKEVSDE